jgi:RNA polymerase sigma factor (sigma-70 family)
MADGGLGIDALLAHSAWIRGLARALVLDSSRADDVVQQTWLAALEHPPGAVRNVRGWLAGLVRNLVRQEKRGEARRGTREQLALRREPLPPAEEVVERADLHRRVVQAVFELDEPQRSTLLLRFYEDLSAEEIARRLELPSSTVRSRIQAALERLRERFDREAGDRRTWSLSLLPLAGASSSSGRIPCPSIPSTSASTGVSSMIVKSLIASALVVATGLGVSRVQRGWSGSTRPSVSLAARSAPPAASGATDESSSSVATTTETEAAVVPVAQRQEAQREARQPLSSPSLRGRVVDVEGKPVAGVPIFIGGQPSPFLERAESGLRLKREERKTVDWTPDHPAEFFEEPIQEALGEWAAADADFLKKRGAVLGKIVRTGDDGAWAVSLPAKARVFVTVAPTVGVHKTAGGAWHESPAEGIDFTVQRIPTAQLALWITDLTSGKRLSGFGGELFRGEERLFGWKIDGELLERTVEVPRGSDTFRAVIDSPAWIRTTHEFRVAGPRAEVEIAVQSGAGFSGQVVDSLGRPVEGAFVFWGELGELREGSLFESYDTKRVTGATRSDLQGRFTLPGTGPQVSAWHAELSPACAPAQSGTPLVLQARGAIHGVVVDETNVPVPGKHVFLDGARETRTDESGAFAFERVEAGVHAVTYGKREQFIGVEVAPGETLEIQPLDVLRELAIPVTSAGEVRPTGGVILGLDRAFSVSEWKTDGARLHTGSIRPGRQLLMGANGLIAVLDIVSENATLELGTAALTLEELQTDDPPVYVLPVEASANPTANHWAARLFGEREGTHLTFTSLRAGRYALIVHGRGTVAELDLADGQQLVVFREQWMAGR